MRYSGLFHVFACLLALAAIAVFCSCGDDTCGPGDQRGSRATVDGLLSFLEDSLEEQEIGWYQECLEDEYMFEFAPGDAESLGLAPWEPTWDKTEDTTAVAHMFGDEAVKQIRVGLTEVQRRYEEDRGDSVVVVVVETDIYVTLQYPGSEPFTFLIRDTYLEITAAPDHADEGLWVIRRIRENYEVGIWRLRDNRRVPQVGMAPLAVTPTSLGLLKAYFYDVSPRSRVSRLLESYAGSCEEGEIGLYEECLDDLYRFIFTPEVADSLGLPPSAPWWGKTHDVAAMSRLFANEDFTVIRFEYQPVSSDTLVKNDSLIVRVRIEPDISVLMEKQGEEPLMFAIDNSYLDFRFTRDPHFPDLWVMLETGEIEKFPSITTGGPPSALTVQGYTYSELKAMFE